MSCKHSWYIVVLSYRPASEPNTSQTTNQSAQLRSVVNKNTFDQLQDTHGFHWFPLVSIGLSTAQSWFMSSPSRSPGKLASDGWAALLQWLLTAMSPCHVNLSKHGVSAWTANLMPSICPWILQVSAAFHYLLQGRILLPELESVQRNCKLSSHQHPCWRRGPSAASWVQISPTTLDDKTIHQSLVTLSWNIFSPPQGFNVRTNSCQCIQDLSFVLVSFSAWLGLSIIMYRKYIDIYIYI